MVVFCLQDCVTSSKSVNEILCTYAVGSGYKINVDNPFCWDFSISPTMHCCLSLIPKASWKHKDIRYLGLRLSENPNDWVSDNILLINTVQQQLLNWQKLPLSWFGCIAVIKMQFFL